MTEQVGPSPVSGEEGADKDTLAGQAGLDLWTCEFCEQPVRKTDDYIQGLDGMRAHRSCVKRWT